MRLDLYVAEKLSVSRTRASNIIKMGGVTVDGKVSDKAGDLVTDGADVVISDTVRFASLGGVKLENALSAFGVSVDGAECLDVGASNGGFTHCLLTKGARRVSAVDLHLAFPPELAEDSRVVSYDGVNVKSLPEVLGSATFDVITVDLSFIPLESLFAIFHPLLRAEGKLIVLFKPQFEVGRAALPKSGVVRDKKVIEKAFRSVVDHAEKCGFIYLDSCPVPEYFTDKNQERTVLFTRK